MYTSSGLILVCSNTFVQKSPTRFGLPGVTLPQPSRLESCPRWKSNKRVMPRVSKVTSHSLMFPDITTTIIKTNIPRTKYRQNRRSRQLATCMHERTSMFADYFIDAVSRLKCMGARKRVVLFWSAHACGGPDPTRKGTLLLIDPVPASHRTVGSLRSNLPLRYLVTSAVTHDTVNIAAFNFGHTCARARSFQVALTNVQARVFFGDIKCALFCACKSTL